MSPLSGVLHSVPPPPLTAASPVLQSEPRTSGWTTRSISGGQKSSPNGSNWHPPPKSADHLHSQTRSRDEAVRSDHSEQLMVFPWRGDFHRTSTLHLMWSVSLSVTSQNFAYWPALRAGLLCCNFFGQPGSVSKFPPFVWVKLWVGWVGRGYTEISRYFPASWINWVTLVTKIKLLYSLRF